jgi:hypothetical protein
MTCGGMNPGPIVSSIPATNSVDARQPSNPAGGCVDAPGYSSIVVTHQNAATGVTPASYAVAVDPVGGPVPAITDVAVNGNDATLTLDQRIPTAKWTVITHIQSATSIRVGNLPGDVDNNKTASAVDILRLIDHLNGVQNYAMFQTDIDRSGVTTSADILRQIDLLNGAGCLDPWINVSLP